MSGLTVFADLVSQPSRSVWWFCKLAKIPHKLQLVNIAKGQNKEVDHLKRHPFGQVPAIDDNGFHLFESHTIMRYLAQKYNTPDHWYSKDLKTRSMTDQYLDWHHSYTRLGAVTIIRHAITYPRRGIPSSEAKKKEGMEILHNALNDIQAYWLKDTPYIKSDKPTIADLSAFEELEQLKLVDYDLAKFDKINAWMSKIRSLEHYDEVHDILNKLNAKVHNVK